MIDIIDKSSHVRVSIQTIRNPLLNTVLRYQYLVLNANKVARGLTGLLAAGNTALSVSRAECKQGCQRTDWLISSW
jgi:hypothetical protein